MSGQSLEIPKSVVGEYLSWDDYYMGFAFWAAKKSKDANTKVGACIVNKAGRIISTGYNGMPNSELNHKLPWANDKKHLYVCYAVMNAIVQAKMNLEGCKIYTSLFPSANCTKMIIQSGITEVIYASDKYAEREETKVAKELFEVKKKEIKIRKFVPKQEKILIDFQDINNNILN